MKAPVDEIEWTDYRRETHTHRWLDYQGKVYIFETPLGNWDWEEKNMVSFQFNGRMCYVASINNSVADSFKSELRWFDSKIWHKMTSWGNNYPEELYFMNGEIEIDSDIIQSDDWKNIYAEASKYSISSSSILESILLNVRLHTGKKYEFPFDNTDYRGHWWEAYIPLELNGESYLLTWKNCD